MKTLKYMTWLLIGLATVVFMACGGGGTTTQNIVPSEAESTSDFLFPEVDTNSLLASPPDTIIRTASSNAEILTTKTEKEKVEVDKDSLIDESQDGTILTFSSLIDINASTIGLPLFVDDTFKGMIVDRRIDGSNLIVTTQDATKISDVYKNFDVMFQNDSIIESIQRSLSSQNIKGRYDYLNTKPLKISIVKKNITNSRNLANEEIVLRIDVPKGYVTPVDTRSVSCSFTDLDCSLTTQGDTSKNLDLGKSYGENGLTFSTEGSYIEIGIGTYLRAHYDYNYIGVDTFDFDLAQSAYFESNLKVAISGTLSKSWEAPIKLIDDFEVEIVHPHSLEIKTTVIVSPQIVLGVNGKITGTLSASSFAKRSGEVRVSYNSANGAHSFDHSVTDTPQNISKDEVALSLEADGNAYVFPAITMLPTLTFARIGPSLTMVNLRSGIKLNTNVNGKIETGFVVENEGEITQNIAMEASLTTSLEGLIQGQWLVRIAPLNLSDMEKCYAFSEDINVTEIDEISNHGETDACFILYQSKDFTDIFSTGKLNILEWKATLLNTPIVDVQEHPGDYNKRDVSFEIDIDEKIQTKVHFYYTLDGSDISVEDIKSHPSVWKLGDAPLEIEKNTKIKVRGVLYNEDVSTSIWAWGTSVSMQTEELISLINKPDITPTSRSFEDSLWINMSQDQGYDIMYQLDSASAVKYVSSFEIEKDTTIVAYARDEVDGVKVYSQETTYEYDMCEDDEKLENGVCVIREEDDPDNASSIYFKPTQAACESAGGSWNMNTDECQASWYEAEKICELPTKEMWEAVITGCGGVLNEGSINIDNDAYQQCYKDLGYKGAWSSTTYSYELDSAWGVYFFSGTVGEYYKTMDYVTYVRCVR